MPSRCANTGMRLSRCTRSISDWPPRGTITSMKSVIVSMMPTAARSVVGTGWIAASGSPAARSPSCRQARIARDEKKLSEPPRRIAALPALRHSAPASAVTFGPRLVDHADHAERHPHARDVEAVRPPPARELRADRIVEQRRSPRARPPSPRSGPRPAPGGRAAMPAGRAPAPRVMSLALAARMLALPGAQAARLRRAAPGPWPPAAWSPGSAPPPGHARPSSRISASRSWRSAVAMTNGSPSPDFAAHSTPGRSRGQDPYAKPHDRASRGACDRRRQQAQSRTRSSRWISSSRPR